MRQWKSERPCRRQVDRGREQPFDGALSLGGLATERELGKDDCSAPQRFGAVVGGLDAGNAREGSRRRPAPEQVLGGAAVAAVAGALARHLFEKRPELLLERVDAFKRARPPGHHPVGALPKW